MSKSRASTVVYSYEKNPLPPKIFISENNINKNKPPIYLNTTITNPIQKPRSKSCPPAKELPCINCKKMCSIDLLEPCERCGNGNYCNEECQYEYWSKHRNNCRSLNMVVKMGRNNSF